MASSVNAAASSGFAEGATTMNVETNTPEHFFERRECRTFEQVAKRACVSGEDFQRMSKEACDRKYILFSFVDCLPEATFTDAEEKEYDLSLGTQAAAESNHADVLFLTNMLVHQ